MSLGSDVFEVLTRASDLAWTRRIRVVIAIAIAILIMVVLFTTTALHVAENDVCDELTEMWPPHLIPGTTTSIHFVDGECKVVEHRSPPVPPPLGHWRLRRNRPGAVRPGQSGHRRETPTV